MAEMVRSVDYRDLSADRTLAAALFREGKALMDKNDFTPACAKLEESERLDPGGGTLLNLALCHEKQGRWNEATEAFQKAIEADPQRAEAQLGLGICLLHQEKPEPESAVDRDQP